MKRPVLCTALSIYLLNCQLLLQLLVISWCRTRCRKSHSEQIGEKAVWMVSKLWASRERLHEEMKMERMPTVDASNASSGNTVVVVEETPPGATGALGATPSPQQTPEGGVRIDGKIGGAKPMKQEAENGFQGGSIEF